MLKMLTRSIALKQDVINTIPVLDKKIRYIFDDIIENLFKDLHSKTTVLNQRHGTVDYLAVLLLLIFKQL